MGYSTLGRVVDAGRADPVGELLNLMNSGPVPVVWLVLTAHQLLIVPREGDDPPLACNLSDVSTIGSSWAGRRESGVSITRGGRVSGRLRSSTRASPVELGTDSVVYPWRPDDVVRR